MSMNVICGLFRLFRFELPFTAGVCVVLGQFLALDGVPRMGDMALGFFSIFCLSATALILNDYFDLEIDRVNAPDRPLPSGQVTKRDVVVLAAVVAALGLAASLAISILAFLTGAVVWIVGILYNWRFKRSGLPGNLMVAFSVGMTFVFGGISVGEPDAIGVWWFAAIAFLMDLGEEIAADAMDMEGDAIIGSRSIALMHGRERALKISAGVFSALILVSLLPFVLTRSAPIFLVPILIMDAVVLLSTIHLLRPNTTNPRMHIRRIYLSGLVAVLLFIGIRLFRSSAEGL